MTGSSLVWVMLALARLLQNQEAQWLHPDDRNAWGTSPPKHNGTMKCAHSP